jgi:hypothetical protein
MTVASSASAGMIFGEPRMSPVARAVNRRQVDETV